RAVRDGSVMVTAGLCSLLRSARATAQGTADGSAGKGRRDSSGPGDRSAPADSSSGGSSGSPSDSTSGVSIGVGVAINYVRVTNEARAPPDSTVSANGATIAALAHAQNQLGASAASGAGGGAVGVAGSVAIEIEN